MTNAAPAVEAVLREQFAVVVAHERTGTLSAWGIADALMALPELRSLVEQAAEAARLRETVARVEALPVVGTLQGVPVVPVRDLRRALDGTDG